MMTIDLSNATNKDKFTAQNGTKLIYYSAGNRFEHAPYSYCMKTEDTGQRHYYSKEGIYFEEKDPGMNLVGCDIIEHQVKKTAPADNSSDNWAIAMKVIAWILFVASVIGCTYMIEHSELTAFTILGVGIIELVITTVLANISITLKESKHIQKQILNELIKRNQTQENKEI